MKSFDLSAPISTKLGTIWSYQDHLLEFLKHHNTVLTHVRIYAKKWDCGTRAQKLRFYAALNRYGRGKARETATTKADLIKLLHVADTEQLYGSAFSVSILFGLLQEAPDKWSASGLSGPKRRKMR